jgi:hypothetical protein
MASKFAGVIVSRYPLAREVSHSARIGVDEIILALRLVPSFREETSDGLLYSNPQRRGRASAGT